MSKRLMSAAAACALLCSCTESTSKLEGEAAAGPCEGEYSFMTPDVKSLLWIAAGDVQMYAQDILRAYYAIHHTLDLATQLAITAVAMGLMTSANIDSITTRPPVGGMSNGKFADIVASKEHRGAIHVFPMKVTCDMMTGLITKFDFKTPVQSAGFTPVPPIGSRLLDAKKAIYEAAEKHPANYYVRRTGGVGQASVSVEVMVQARIARPMSDLNKLLTGVVGVPWIQNWVKVTATCDPIQNRVEAQFTKMPSSSLWVNDALEQSHGQEGLGDFIMNYANKLGPLHDKFNKPYDVADADICASTMTCYAGRVPYTTSYDYCPIIDSTQPDPGTTEKPPACSTALAEAESSLGSDYRSICFMDPEGNGALFDVPCRSGQQWNGKQCANPQTGCVDRCVDAGGCWLYDDGKHYTCVEGSDGCLEPASCEPWEPIGP